MGNNDWYEMIKTLFYTEDNPFIRIDHNKHMTIQNVNIHLSPKKICCPYNKGYRNRLQKLTISDNIFLNTVMDKQIYLVNRLEEFKYIVEKESIQPVIRMLALFSPFSTLRNESDTDDLSKLELEEKKILINLTKYGCIFKIILNLDFARAFACGYGIEEISKRVGDLCNVCDELENNNNFLVAIDMGFSNYEPIWTFDEVLIEKQMVFNKRSNYSSCYWSSNINEIMAFNMNFDKKFMEESQKMYTVFNTLHIKSLSNCIHYYLSEWIKMNYKDK